MDAGLTPQILVNATVAGVDVPNEFVKDGAIVLNVHDRAVRDLDIGNETVNFSARFSGRPRNVLVPMEAVLAIYARENGQGLFFELPGTSSGDEQDATTLTDAGGGTVRSGPRKLEDVSSQNESNVSADMTSVGHDTVNSKDPSRDSKEGPASRNKPSDKKSDGKAGDKSARGHLKLV